MRGLNGYLTFAVEAGKRLVDIAVAMERYGNQYMVRTR